jgi:5-(carboxyamino)imidazole ribonucleotide synthase
MTTKMKIGVLGAGQLALMLAEAGERLGVEVICAGRPGDCAERVAPVLAVELDDAGMVSNFAEHVDVVTIETENIDAEVLRGIKLFPNAKAVGIAQDRLVEKTFLQSCGIDVAPFAAVNCVDDLKVAMAKTGLPGILKTRRMGYDGKGQARIYREEDALAAWEAVGKAPSILEGMVAFDTEVSLLAARDGTGKIVFWPLIQNQHRDGILRRSDAPYMNMQLQSLAESYLKKIMEELEYVGVLTVEFFVQGERLIANEMAPRVHNSGHWTIEGAQTSQFENHLRAIAGMELGPTDSKPMVMLNCIGWMPEESETAKFAALLRHDYGKAARPGRKVGHLTFAATEMAAIGEWEKRLAEHS